MESCSTPARVQQRGAACPLQVPVLPQVPKQTVFSVLPDRLYSEPLPPTQWYVQDGVV